MTKHCAALHWETKAGEMAGLGKRGNRDRDREGGRLNVKFWTQMKIASICRTGGRQPAGCAPLAVTEQEAEEW